MGNKSFGKGYSEGYKDAKKNSEKDYNLTAIITFVTGIALGAIGVLFGNKK